MNSSVELATSNKPRRSSWLRRVAVGFGIYLLVGFLTSFLGFNLLGAIFSSGPFIGRVVDASGKGIPDAFVSYEWKGQSLHGTTGCKAAAIVRTGAGGTYFVPWQGWRLVFATGWGISPAGPAIWAPGYVAVSDGHGGTQMIPEKGDAPERSLQTGAIDKGGCFGRPYRSSWIELRKERFARTFDRLCVAKASLAVMNLSQLSGDMVNVALAQEGALLYGSVPTMASDKKYQTLLEQIAWPKRSIDPSAQATAAQRDGLCTAVKTDYLGLGGRFNEN